MAENPTHPQPDDFAMASSRRTWDGGPLTPGVNVDRVDIAAGAAEAAAIGYDSETDQMVVVYALQRHARGEEDGAERTALGHGVDLTSWYRIRAAALASLASPDADADAGADHECDTGHFDRTICAEPCGMMHSYCAFCGVRQDRCAHDGEEQTMSRISEAVETMSGNELVAFLTTFDYRRSTADPAAGRAEFGSIEYGEQYNDSFDAGTLIPEPDSWSEVEHLRAVGKLDRDVYYQVLEGLVHQPPATP